MAILGVYVFFGLTGPLTVRYLDRILGAIGTEGIVVEFPKPVPADGISQFIGVASQIGLLVVVLAAASALAFDSRREMAVFLRSRVTSVHRVVLPAYTMSAAAAIAGISLGILLGMAVGARAVPDDQKAGPPRPFDQSVRGYAG